MPSLVTRIEDQLAALDLPLSLELPNGRRFERPDARVTLSFRDWTAIPKLAARQIGAIGAAYVEGSVHIEGAMRDLVAAAVTVLPEDPAERNTDWMSRLGRLLKSRALHSLRRDEAQIKFHYDVSDDFYKLWLDPRRVYSCAYFRSPGMTLAQAQEAKLDHICRKLMLKPGDRFLDIGCGWGALLLWAAERCGVEATGITLSRNQLAHVKNRIRDSGMQHLVRVKLVDYRELESDPFDKIASVGMLEHVGSANMGAYFSKLSGLLRPGGLVLNHGITSSQLDYKQLGAGMGDFIEKYIFPGGELLHVTHLLRETAMAGLEMLDTENLRPHYARTLWSWSDSLESQLDHAQDALLRAPGATKETAGRILRAYRLYLAGSAMAFEQGWIGLHQMLASKPTPAPFSSALPGSRSPYPFTRDYMYSDAELV